MTTDAQRLDPLRKTNLQCEKPINQNTLFMQNKPNLCGFWPVNGDFQEKQTQFQSQFKPNFLALNLFAL